MSKSDADIDGFIDHVGTAAKGAAIVKGGSIGLGVGSAAASELIATGLVAASPSGPAMLVIVPTVLGAYFGYRIVNSIFGD